VSGMMNVRRARAGFGREGEPARGGLPACHSAGSTAAGSTAAGRVAAEGSVHAELCRLEAQRDRLAAELCRVETLLRRLRRARACSRCLGAGKRPVRGGLYGELRDQPCSCRRSHAAREEEGNR
jgi:hypothetical protein